MSTLRDRCAKFAETGGDLEAFVISEIGRAASDTLTDSHALVLFFESPEGAQEIADAIHAERPGMIARSWP